MSIEWDVVQLERNASDGGVTVVHWIARGTEGDLSAKRVGTVSLTPDASAADFIAFDSLTKETVLGWVEGKDDIESSINEELLDKQNPTSLNGLPW